MNTDKRKFSTKTLAVIGLMAALVFVGNMLRIIIPISPIDNTAIHLGNIFCLLSALLLGGVGGGLCAGLGGFLYDLTNPLYASEAVITFAFKFALAFVCGIIAYSRGKNAENTAVNIIAAIAGSLAYVVLYISKGIIKDLFFLTVPMETALANAGAKTVTSLVNAAIAVVLAVPLYHAIKAALKTAKISLR